MPFKDSQFSPYDVCQRCGIEYHSSQLTMQLGLLVCTATCVDNLNNRYREREIDRVLSDGQNEGGSWRDEVILESRDEDEFN